jgi:RNA polymerase sigma-70 factor (ECF subfamily)
MGRISELSAAELVQCISSGDQDGEAELVRRYKDGVSIIIERTVGRELASEDISQETFRIVLEKLRHGDVREPERLSGFVSGVARNQAVEHARRVRKTAGQEDAGAAEQMASAEPDPLARVLDEERAETVRRTLNELKVDRDREILVRYYLLEQDKAQIADDLNLTSKQFNGVIFRALKRFRELYQERSGCL